MTLLCVLIYIVLISACGCFPLRRLEINQVLLLPTGFMVGSILMGGAMFVLVSTGNVSPIPVGMLVISMSVIGILGMPTLFRSLRAAKDFLYSHVYAGKYRAVLTIVLLAGLALYLASTYTPPRSGDAMRYHLAQVKDIVKHEGFIYRPYYCYNLPQYFHYLFIPVFMTVGGVSMQLAVLSCFLLVIFMTLYLSHRTKQGKQLLFLALFLIFIPIFTYLSTHLATDIPVILYGLIGFLLILEFGHNHKIHYLILAYTSLGVALGCKYQAILYFPLYLVATFLVMRRKWNYSFFKCFTIIPLSFIPFLVASPFLIRNIYYTSDPCWPLLQDLFQVKKDYLYQVTQAYTHAHGGHLDFDTLSKAVVRVAKYPYINSIIWILCAGYYFTRYPLGMTYKVGTALYLCMCFLMRPNVNPRYGVYILPILGIMAITFCEWCYERYSRLGKLPYIIALFSIVVGIGFSIYYSTDFIRYHVTRDLKHYHRLTWFYNHYQWMNQHLKDDGKVLVIVSSGHTYYLDKEYLRADPCLTGLIDWTAVGNTKELRDILHKLQVRYIFYDDHYFLSKTKDWSAHPGGSNMMRLINQLKKEEDVSILFEDNDVKLGREVRRYSFYHTKVFLLQLDGVGWTEGSASGGGN